MKESISQKDMKDYQKEQDELAKDAPLLFSLKGNSPFKAPAGYLENLPDELKASVIPDAGKLSTPENYQDELVERLLAVGSDKRVAKEDFKMPEGYLQELQSNIAKQTIAASDSAPRGNNGIVIRIASWVATAAAACLIALLVIKPFEKEDCQSFTCMLESVELSSDDFLELYDEEIVEELLPENASILDGIEDNDEMIDYLLDEDIELLDLYELDEI